MEVSAYDHVCPLIEATLDKVRKTLPVATGELLEGNNRDNGTRVGRDKADERLEVKLRAEG